MLLLHRSRTIYLANINLNKARSIIIPVIRKRLVSHNNNLKSAVSPLDQMITQAFTLLITRETPSRTTMVLHMANKVERTSKRPVHPSKEPVVASEAQAQILDIQTKLK